jgi:AraC-like DNA-binding protein
MTLPLRSAIKPETEIFGIPFRPGVAQQMLGVDAKELRNQHVPLRTLWPRDRHVRWEAVAAGTLITAKFAAISEVVAKRVTAIDKSDVFVTDAAAWMASHPSGRIEELGRLSGLSERQMRRRFDRAIGFGPKTLQRIMRLQYLLWLASRQEHAGRSLARLAIAAGYADQSHMTRDVVALTGASPRLLLNGATGSAVSDLFKTATS